MKTFLVAAITADGFIGQDANHLSTMWTSGSDKRLFMRLAKESGTIIMGITTFLTTAEKYPTVFTKSIPGRRLIVYTHHPEKTTKYPAEIETTQEPPQELIKRLESEKVKSAVIAGGAQVYRQFLQASMIDEIYLNVQPQLFGTGVPLLDAPMNIPLHLIDTQTDATDGATTLHYNLRP